MSQRQPLSNISSATVSSEPTDSASIFHPAAVVLELGAGTGLCGMLALRYAPQKNTMCFVTDIPEHGILDLALENVIENRDIIDSATPSPSHSKEDDAEARSARKDTDGSRIFVRELDWMQWSNCSEWQWCCGGGDDSSEGEKKQEKKQSRICNGSCENRQQCYHWHADEIDMLKTGPLLLLAADGELFILIISSCLVF